MTSSSIRMWLAVCTISVTGCGSLLVEAKSQGGLVEKNLPAVQVNQSQVPGADVAGGAWSVTPNPSAATAPPSDVEAPDLPVPQQQLLQPEAAELRKDNPLKLLSRVSTENLIDSVETPAPEIRNSHGTKLTQMRRVPDVNIPEATGGALPAELSAQYATRQLQLIDRKLDRLLIDVAMLEQRSLSGSPVSPEQPDPTGVQLALLDRRLQLLQARIEQLTQTAENPAQSSLSRSPGDESSERNTDHRIPPDLLSADSSAMASAGQTQRTVVAAVAGQSQPDAPKHENLEAIQHKLDGILQQVSGRSLDQVRRPEVSSESLAEIDQKLNQILIALATSQPAAAATPTSPEPTSLVPTSLAPASAPRAAARPASRQPVSERAQHPLFDETVDHADDIRGYRAYDRAR